VLTGTVQRYRHRQAFEFAALGGAWALSLFGVMRLAWFQGHVLLPLTRLQAAAAAKVIGTPAGSIDVTLACSAADAFALCAGAILGYPARWQARLAGVGGVLVVILGLNTARIGVLGRAVGSPRLFDALHLYVWPAVITIAIAAYVFAWMRVADRERGARQAHESTAGTWRTRHFAMLALVLLVLFTALAPFYLESAGVLGVAAFVAHAAAATLNVIGVDAAAAGNVLSTARGAFVVTQECITTPLIPVYVAGVVAYPCLWRWKSLALLATVPLFVLLGIARLLVVALPAALVGSPMFLIHAFYQLLLAGVLVVLAAIWRHGTGAAARRRALGACALGAALIVVLGPLYTRSLSAGFAAAAPLHDPQGAIAFLPSFQAGLYVALFAAVFAARNWKRFLLGFTALALSQTAVLMLLDAVARNAGLVPRVSDVRGWALALPLLLVAVLTTHERARR
jgi:exosortase/archaeosortase family protein